MNNLGQVVLTIAGFVIKWIAIGYLVHLGWEMSLHLNVGLFK